VYVGRRLGPEMFGVITFCTGVLLYFKNTAECGIDLLGVRHIAEDQRRIVTHAPALLGARLVVAVILAGLIALVAPRVLPEPEGRVFALYGLTLLAVGPDTRWIHLGLQRSKPVAIARALGELTYLGLVLLFVRETQDIPRVPLAAFAGDALACALLFAWLRRSGFRLGVQFDWKQAQPILARSWPLVVNVLLGLTIYNSDLIFLRVFQDRRTVGWYSASYQLISFLINMAAAYSLSLLPALTRVAGDRARRDALYGDATAQTFAVGLPIAVGGALLAAPIIALVFGPEFEPSARALAILICTLPFTLSKEVDLIALIVAGRERTVMRMTAAAVAVNLALNLALIPSYGMLGAAISTLATEIARAAFARVCAAREAYPWTGFVRRWRSLVASAAMALGLVWLGDGSLGLALAAGVAIYAIALALVGGLRWRAGVPVLTV
jgi:O-antigen/teichoic acid export membrane protein